MAEDQGKEEEKFDFTGEGEAVGYISLVQARVLAMSTAREIPGEYGSSYQGVPMAFEVTVATEDEDFYNITLSFRPQTTFSGRPGQEQFFIEKEGTVAHRQVLFPPGRGRRFPVLPVAIGLVVVGVIAAVAAVLVLDSFGAGEGLVALVAPGETNTPTEKVMIAGEAIPIPPSVTLNPGIGSAGDSILFYGTGFPPSRRIETLIVGGGLASADSVVSDADGKVDTKFSIPSSTSLGSQQVLATSKSGTLS